MDSRRRKRASPWRAKISGTVRAGALLEVGVEVEEGPAEAGGEEASDGGFAGAHEAGEDEALEPGGGG